MQKIREKSTHKTHLKGFSGVFLLFCILCITSLISATTWDESGLEDYLNLAYPLSSGKESIKGSINLTTSAGNPTFGSLGAKYKNAVYFDGTDDSLRTINSENFGWKANSSLSFWINITEYLTDYDYILYTGGDAHDIGIYSDGDLFFQMDGFEFYRPDLNTPEGKYIHIVETFNDTHTTIFINGSLSSIYATTPNNVTNNITIGSKANGEQEIKGWFDEFYIFNKSLSSSNVSDLYNSGSGIFFDELNKTLNITLNSPDDLETFIINNDINFNITNDLSIGNLKNISLYINDTFNESKTITGLTNETTFTKSFSSIGNYNWSVEVCNDENNCKSSKTREFNINYYKENEFIYNSTSYETYIETFILNVTTNGSSILNPSLVYNGTSYIATITNEAGNTYLLSKELEIPIGIGNKEFYFNFDLEGNNYNSTKYNQTISDIVFTQCNATYNNVYVNYTIYNETSLGLINASIDATFIYYIGSSKNAKNYSISTTNETLQLCANSNDTFIVNAIIKLNKAGYSERTYHFNDENYNNDTTEERLYLLDTGSDIIIQVRDSGLIPLKNYYVEIERFYPGTNSYKIIEREKTDEYGQFVARLVENDEKYKFTFRDSNNVLKKTTDDMTIACPSTFCTLRFVMEYTGEDLERFENVTDYDWTFSFNNNTNIFSVTWNDVSGESITNRLYVQRNLWNGSTIVCNSTSTSSSGTLTCDVGNSSASYQAQFFRKISGEIEKRISYINVKVGTEFETFGKEGLLWSFFLLMTLITIGYWKPVVGVVLYLGGIILLSMVNIISLNPGILIAQFVIGIIFIWAFRG